MCTHFGSFAGLCRPKILLLAAVPCIFSFLGQKDLKNRIPFSVHSKQFKPSMTFSWKNIGFSEFCFLPSARSIILNQQKPAFGALNDRKLSHSDYLFLARIAPLFLSCLFFRFMCLQSHLKTVAKLCVWSTKCLPCDFSAPPNWQNHTYCISCYHHHSQNWSFFPHRCGFPMLPALDGEHNFVACLIARLN